MKKHHAWLAAGLLVGLIVALALSSRALAPNFPYAVSRILAHEGCTYENHPRDPGGPTKCGVTLSDVRRYIKPGAGADDVRALTRDTAIWIYREKYAKSPGVRFDDLPAGLDYFVLDYGVNAGVRRSGAKLRQALGFEGRQEWRITDAVIAAARRTDLRTLLYALFDERHDFYHALPTCDVFCGGWDNRNANVLAASLGLAGYRSALPIEAPEFTPGKAIESTDDLDMVM